MTQGLQPILVLLLVTIFSLSESLGQGHETFENIPTENTSQYIERSWTGDDGIELTATNARTDQIINGKAICVRNGSLKAHSVANGIGSLAITTKRAFTGGTGNLTLKINDSETGSIPYSVEEQTTIIENINIEGSFSITIKTPNNSDRIKIDDLIWSEYGEELTKVSTPTFSPPEGTYDTPQVINIETDTDGADIYFTLNGSNPAETDHKFTDPFDLDDNAIIKARAFKKYSVASNPAVAEYIIKRTISTSSLPSFRKVYTDTYSDIQFYYVDMSALEENLIIESEYPLLISLDCNVNYNERIDIDSDKNDNDVYRIYVKAYPETSGVFEPAISHTGGDFTEDVTAHVEGTQTQIPAGYYSTATTSGSRLKAQLHNIIKDHTVASYNSIWSHFENTDATFCGKVWDIYSYDSCKSPSYLYNFMEDQDSGVGGGEEGDVYNREHSFPRAWFGGDISPMLTDIFHVYPVDKFINSTREDYPFGEVDNPTWVSSNGSKLGPNIYDEYSGTVFEPVDEFKGDLARTYLYMITRYENLLEDWTYNEYGMAMLDNNKYPGLEPWVIEMFLKWHELDPVSHKERMRNDAIYQIQGNRNPFIDHPEFVEKIWGDTTLAVINKDFDYNVSIYPLPANEYFYYSAPEKISEMHIISINGQIIMQKKPLSREKQINISHLESGVYILRLYGKQNVFSGKLLVR